MQRGKQREPLDPDPLGPPGRSHINPPRLHGGPAAVEQTVRQAGARGAAPAGRGPARPEAFRDRCKSQSSKTDAEGQAARPIGFGASRTPCPISHRILSISMVDRCSRASGETGRGARGRARRARPRAPGSISRPMQERCRGASSKNHWIPTLSDPLADLTSNPLDFIGGPMQWSKR